MFEQLASVAKQHGIPLPAIVLRDTIGVARAFPLTAAPYFVGSAPGNNLQVNDRSVSAFHLVIQYAPRAWRLRDLGSRNGTWLNGVMVARTARLKQGDIVQFGHGNLLALVLSDPESDREPAGENDDVI